MGEQSSSLEDRLIVALREAAASIVDRYERGELQLPNQMLPKAAQLLSHARMLGLDAERRRLLEEGRG